MIIFRCNCQVLATKQVLIKLPQREALKTLPLLFRYIGIGSLVFILYVGIFQLLIMAQVYRPLATTSAYVLSVSTHFFLNKFLNFRNFERSIAHQLKSYVVVVIFCWLVTVLVIEACVRGLGLAPWLAQLVAVAVNIPTGFLGNYYLIFGGGIKALLRMLQRYFGKPR